MRKTKYTVKYTSAFKKDYKRAIKRGWKIELLEQVVALLSMGEPLPDKNRDHELTSDWVGHRECHIQPDWLLIYRIEDDVLVLTLARTGTHSGIIGRMGGVFADAGPHRDAQRPVRYMRVKPPYGETRVAVFLCAEGICYAADHPESIKAGKASADLSKAWGFDAPLV